ncbi:MAG: sigma-54-dependent Fis family transcriptional regulator, partial [Gammaproteobacteria bacterium]|nr:sigma-54-dependent Fis family transcriptional regulator [Gammaproteobacteria bacterium]
IQRAMVVADGPTLSAVHLGLESALPAESPFTAIAWANQAVSADLAEVPAVASATETRAASSLADRRAMQEAELIMETLKASPTKTMAAERLGISERTLRYKLARLREHGLMAAGL